MKKLALLLLLPISLYAQTIRPTFISQLRLTQLTTAQEGGMTLVEGDIWENITIGCIRYRLASSTVCIAESGSGAGSAVLLNPTAEQTISGFGLNVLDLNNVRKCDQFAGADAGVKIAACIAALPSTGGIADARGLEGAQTIATDLWASTTTPFLLLLGGGTYSFSAAQTVSSVSKIIGLSSRYSTSSSAVSPTILRWTGGASAMFTVTSREVTFQDVGLTNAGTGTVAIQINENYSKLFRIAAITESGEARWSSFVIAYDNSATTIQHSLSQIFINNAGEVAEIDIPRGNVFDLQDVHLTAMENIGIRVGNTATVTSLHWRGGTGEPNAASQATAKVIQFIRSEASSVEGVHFELNAAGHRAIAVEPSGVSDVNGLDISGANRFQGGSVADYSILLAGTGGADNVSIHNNLFKNHVVAGVLNTTLNSNGREWANGLISTSALLSSTSGFVLTETDSFFVDNDAVISPKEGSLSNVPRWILKVVDFGDMTAAATAATFTLWTLPANTLIENVMGEVVTGWSGGTISAAVCSVGTQAGSANDLTLDDNFFTTGTRYELHDATANGGKGTLLFDATDKFAPHMFIAGGVVEIQCDLTGDNHANATAGQARIYILVSQPLGNTTIEAN